MLWVTHGPGKDLEVCNDYKPGTIVENAGAVCNVGSRATDINHACVDGAVNEFMNIVNVGMWSGEESRPDNYLQEFVR